MMQNRTSTNQSRCDWLTNDIDYIAYHDNEWGKPEYDSQKLFEQLCLEGQQAGLSWLTVLKKREAYQRCFYDFNPEKIVKMTESERQNLCQNANLIRHVLKLNSIYINAQAYLKMQQNGEDFADFIWSFVDHNPIINRYHQISEIPKSTDISKRMSQSLKKRSFSFVGETICYAFMQAMGLVDDHLVTCCKKQFNFNKTIMKK